MTEQSDTSFRPLVCADLELTNPVAPAQIPDGAGLYLLVRDAGVPVGELTVEPDDVAAGPQQWAQQAREDQEKLSLPTSATVELPAASPALSAALAICTIGTHPLLPSAVQHLLEQQYDGDFHVVVVDNAPATGNTRAALAGIDDARLKIVDQPNPGLSFARNAALAEAVALGSELLFYTDDDALADPHWLSSKAAVFAQDPDVHCVTGLVVPGSLATHAEQMFEEGSGFNKGYVRTVWSRADDSSSVWKLGARGDGGPLFPFAAGAFGSGNSTSFRVSALTELNGFDPALGAGTLTKGGEDLDIFVRVLMSDGTIVYEPRAVIRHFHRDTMEELAKQMVGYGSGLSAFLFRELLFLPGSRVALLRAVPKGIKRMLDPESEKNENRTADYPAELAKAERGGFVRGPWLYLKARRRARALSTVKDVARLTP